MSVVYLTTDYAIIHDTYCSYKIYHTTATTVSTSKIQRFKHSSYLYNYPIHLQPLYIAPYFAKIKFAGIHSTATIIITGKNMF